MLFRHRAPAAEVELAIRLDPRYRTEVMEEATSIPSRTIYAQYGKPLLDRFVGVLLTILTLPVVIVLLLTAWAVFGWPPLNRSVRIGRRGKHFNLYRINTHHNRTVDLRGRRLRYSAFVRRTSLDELPQVWNVALGHMSLVGPRPLDPGTADELPGSLRQRHAARPGLTGPWQVEARGDGRDLPDHVAVDLSYVKQISFSGDMSLLLRTIPALMKHRETV